MGKVKLAVIVLLVLLSIPLVLLCGTSSALAMETGTAPFRDYKEIPGITDDEIAAITALQETGGPLIYAALASGEAYARDGELYGFTALYCRLLSDMFGVEIQPRIYEWNDILDGLENSSIAFTGEMTATEERRANGYYMTDAIAERSIRYTQLEGRAPITDMAEGETPVFAFLRGAKTAQDVAANVSYEFETVFMDDRTEAYERIATGEIDAFFGEGRLDTTIDGYSGFDVHFFIPVITNPVSMTTKDARYAPMISVMQKALALEDFRQYLSDLYTNPILKAL